MNDYTDLQKIIEGCLLGDAHLELHKHGKNASFNYISSSKQHTEYVHSFFKEYCTDNYQEVKRWEYFDKRTNKTYVTYRFKTKCLPIFTEQHKRFYVNRIKIVPLDLELNEDVVLLWYIGDGELESVHGYVKLHTNSFTQKEVQFLCNKLNMFDAKPLHKENNQYLVTIPRRKVKEFLNYIGECPIDDYKHKWKFVPYKNKNIELNGVNYYNEYYPTIVSEYLSGATIYELHKKYGVPIKCIKHNFDYNKIMWTPKETKKKILQYDLNGNFIKEWNSGQEIVKTLKFSSGAISFCCNGKRKTHKGYIWKFKNQ